MKLIVFALFLLLNSLTMIGQPVYKKYVNNSISSTKNLSNEKIKVVDVKVYPRFGYRTTPKENTEFVKSLSKKTGLDTTLIMERMKMSSGNDEPSYLYLIPQSFWDVKNDSIFSVINSSLKFKKKQQLTGWFIYVYFTIGDSKVKHETYSQVDDNGVVEKFLLIQ